MRVGMMQPYFFPYLGYFGLIHATDRWVVFDTPQYIRRGWVNRNRILSSCRNGWKYVRVPVAHCDQTTAIHDVHIATQQDWQLDFFNSLSIYQLRKAPYFQATIVFLQDTLSFRTDRLNDLLIHCLRACCQHVGLPFQCEQFSSMNLKLPNANKPGDWALETCRNLSASEYVNPPGGRYIFEADRFEEAQINLKFLQPELPTYEQGQSEFLPGLSIIDALMWNHPDRVREMIGDYRLETA